MIIRILRISLLYLFWSVICLIVTVVVFADLSNGVKVFASFLLPILFVWFSEKRRLTKKNIATSNGNGNGNGNEARPDSSYSIDYDSPANSLLDNSLVEKQQVVPKNKSGQKSKWLSKEEVVTIGGRNVSGMLYVGTPPKISKSIGSTEKSKPFIDLSLSVSKKGSDKEGNALPYWPCYSDIPAQCRATYLDWLSCGRSDTTFSQGYLFLYFYGLERRFLLDQSTDNEKREILEEVQRLKDLYTTKRSVQRYLGEFLEIAKFSFEETKDQEPLYERVGWDIPLTTKLALGRMIANDQPINAEWLLSWFTCHEDSRMRTPATRCVKEFRALFCIIFDARFPSGLKIRKPRKNLKLKYQAASGEFELELRPEVNGQPVLDITGLRKPIEIAQEIADETMDELEKFSRYLGRNPDNHHSLEALALLPWRLAVNHHSAEVGKLRTWSNSIISDGGLLPVTSLLQELEGSEPEKISKRQLISASDTLARFGYGMAPDPRFALRSPKITEPVVLFPLKSPTEKLTDVSAEYRNVLIKLTLGSFIAHADGEIPDAELKALHTLIETSNLDEEETSRLRANLKWLMVVPPDMSLLRRQIKDASPEQIISIRETVVSIAHSDSVIQSQEVASIEKIYKVLGLKSSTAYSDLHAIAVENGPITVKLAEATEPGETIPPEENRPSGITPLDAARIAAIRSDTDRVSSVLGDIFDTAEDDSVQKDATSTVSILKGLDAKHAIFVRDILVQEHWSDEAFSELATSHNLMPAGALETVNEWSFEAYNDALLDEYEGYDVSPEISKELNNLLKQDAQK